MTTTAPPTSRLDVYRKYVAWIESTCASDPGARVALRRGLRRGLDDVPGLHRIVAVWLPEGCSRAEERAYYAVAAMIADRPRHSFNLTDTDTEDEAGSPLGESTADGPGTAPVDAATQPTAPPDGPNGRPPRARRDSLGASFAHAVHAQAGQGTVREDTAEARLNLLTRQSLDGLHRHLPGSVRLLRNTGTPIDFAVLLHDLAAWPGSSKTISRRWLQDFYRKRRVAREETARRHDTDSADEPAPDQD